jgi:tRNA (guanine-N7-)-methyltransferase
MEQNKYLRSFGRTKGHKLSQNQEQIINEFLPKIRPNKNILKKQNIWLEIGFGAGEHIIQLIDERIDTNQVIIGCEPYINGAVKVLKYIKENNIENVFIFDGDARDLLDDIECIDRCYILFPDPWPKKRHHKRRVVSFNTIQTIFSKLTSNGIITVATDHMGYSEWIKEVLSSLQYSYSELKTLEECRSNGILTRYCKKALDHGSTIKVFQMNHPI